ncbi:MAG: YMGG-like glycine zipper-containing protein [Gemmatirosa sp.]
MPQYIRRRVPLAFALAAVATVAACGGSEKTEAALQDSALNRDLALANQDSAAQPQLQDVPAETPAPLPEEAAPIPAPAPPRATPRPAPATPRPATPRPATPAPTTPTRTASGNTVTPTTGGSAAGERSGTATIPSGTTLALTSNSRVCTNTHKVGDRFTATVSDAVAGANGARVPSGATATVEVTKVDRSENVRDKIEMGFRVVALTFGGRTYAVDATTESADVSRVRNQPSSKDRQKVIGGAVIGAIAGQVIGKDTKGTIIGAATGAAAGAATAAATANYEGCLNDGARLAIRLTDGVQIRM